MNTASAGTISTSATSGNDACAGASRSHEVYERARRDPVGFWGDAAGVIDWYEKPAKVFDPTAGVYGRWYVGATCNTCYNAVDRHVLRGRGMGHPTLADAPSGANR